MTDYKEILRLESLGINQTGIARSCSWPLKLETTDADLQMLLFLNRSMPAVDRKYPDYEYIDKEMMRNGGTLKLLWMEYCETCRQSKELPLMYSQFCFHYQKYEIKSGQPCTFPVSQGNKSRWIGPAKISMLLIGIQEL